MEPPAGIGPTGASEEVSMPYHLDLLPRIVVILRIVVKIIVTRRQGNRICRISADLGLRRGG
jgi:hypothetical protein